MNTPEASLYVRAFVPAGEEVTDKSPKAIPDPLPAVWSAADCHFCAVPFHFNTCPFVTSKTLRIEL